METLKKIGKQSLDFYRGLTPARRWSLGLLLALSVAFFVFVALVLARDDYRSLGGGMAAEEVQATVARLKERNIPARVRDAGDGVEVPASRLDEARMELAAAGLPRAGGAGFELFDHDDLGMTRFKEQITFQRALEGELARSIRSLKEVRSARVHLVLPQRSLFRDEQREPSASVMVNLLPGADLDAARVKGIRYLVSSAVEGLRPGRVTVIDGQGRVLARLDEGDSGGLSDERVAYQREIERLIERRILDLLEPLVGAGRVVAQVTAEVDFDKVVETREEFNPDRAVVRSEQRSSESRSRESAIAAGVVGTPSNLPGGGGSATAAQPGDFQRSSETLSYEIDKKVQRTERPQGSLKRLSAAVVVDGSYRSEGKGANARPVYQPRSPEEMERFAVLVKKAVGFDEQRGDQVEVSNLAFETVEVPEAPSLFVAWWERLDGMAAARIAGLVLLGVLLFFFGVRPALRGLLANRGQVVLPPGKAMTVSELEQRLGPAGLLGSGAGAAQEPAQHLRQIASQNPERVVHLLKNWLEEESK